jgi:phosphate transport system substrate-binding protein
MSLQQSLRATLLAASALLAPAAAAQVTVDPELPIYRPVEGVSGAVRSNGSDTMLNLMTLWANGFRGFYPSVQVEIKGDGSASAPSALVEGTVDFGPMSRAMKDKEIEEFEKAYGYKPTAVETSIDMLAVYVHRDNPIAGLTLAQVDAIFSKARTGGHPEDITTWGQLGLTGAWADQRIDLYGRNSASGTYGYFKDHALFKGDFKDEVKEQPGSSSVVSAVAQNPYAIGYSGIGYRTADVRPVPLAKSGTEFVEPAVENLSTYPLARFLYVYLNYEPGSELDPLRREFLHFVYSRQGQEQVIKDGYLPVSAKVARKALGRVGLELPAPVVEAGAPRE